MKDVSDWLKAIGMSEYAGRFAENSIDVSVLRDLSDQDLKELGVTLGHRRKMQRAIAELEAAQSPPAPAPPPTPSPRDAAERRQLTVMFCDLVGSTALSARLDPEDVRDVIGAYHRCCAALIEQHGGFVAKYMGDGVLAYFGYPIAHEHDAERAVRTGLAIVAAAPKLETAAATPLQVRVGIATGIVVVGDLLGSGEAQERGIVGDTPNLAARLQVFAEPGSVVIADNTRRLIGDLFELRDLGAQDLKGIAGPTRAWAAVRANTQTSRFEALHAGGLSPLVGREDECELMLQRWAKAKTGDGQVVLLSGEAGIGKSRLTAAFLELLADAPHRRLRYFCSPQHEDSAFFPIIGQIERAAGFGHDDDAKGKLDKLDTLLAAAATSPEDAALIADLLSLPNDGRHPTLTLAPTQRRQKTMEALGTQIDTLTRGHPVLMIFEDAHWADPSSLEIFGRLVDRIASVRVLLFVTSRPEFAAPWIGRPNVTALTLNRLTQIEVIALIDRVVGNKALAADIRQDIVERADGVPLFVEEMTKAVMEAQSEGAGRAIAAIPGAASTVPATLHATLMARLDRLGEAKAVAQIGAAIGREFSHDLIAAVFRGTEPELDLALDRLVDAGLMFRQGTAPHATYLFKHALVQDAAYGTMLREPRRALHARIAEALPIANPDVAEARPEILARHCSEAALTEKAAGLWGKAGEQSVARSALVEGEAQLKRALAQMMTLPGTPALRRLQIKLQVSLANTLVHTVGYAASETTNAFEKANSLIAQAEEMNETLEDPLAFYSVLYGFWIANLISYDGFVVRDLSTQFLGLAHKQRSEVPIMIGHRLMGMSLIHTGDLVEGRAHLDRVLPLYDPRQHRPLMMRFGQDVRVATCSYRSWALWMLGHPDAAREDAYAAVQDARDMGHVPSLMYALHVTLVTTVLLGDYDLARARIDELLRLAEDKGAQFWKASGMLHKLCLLSLSGNATQAVDATASIVHGIRATGSTAWASYYLPHAAKAHACLGLFDEAWRLIDEARSFVVDKNERWLEPDVHRITGEIVLLATGPDNPKVRSYFECSLETARAQQARSFELRAATSLARLFRDQGQRGEARELLVPIYGWFTEGFDTRDLREAKAVLDELPS